MKPLSFKHFHPFVLTGAIEMSIAEICRRENYDQAHAFAQCFRQIFIEEVPALESLLIDKYIHTC